MPMQQQFTNEQMSAMLNRGRINQVNSNPQELLKNQVSNDIQTAAAISALQNANKPIVTR